MTTQVIQIQCTPVQKAVLEMKQVGIQGPKGDPGIGLPPGGTTGQVPIKQSNADYDLAWGDQSGGSGSVDLNQALFLSDVGPMEGYTTPYLEVRPISAFPTHYIWYTDSLKTKRVSDLQITYTGVFPTVAVFTIYQPNGTTVKKTVTDTITYQGVFIDNIHRTVV